MNQANQVVVPIKVSELQEGFKIFGNRGAVLMNKAHIFEVGFKATTLCDTPMLSSNYASLECTEVGCEACIEIYNTIIEPLSIALYKDELSQKIEFFENEEYWKDICIVDNKYRVRGGLKKECLVNEYFFKTHEALIAQDTYNFINAEKLRTTIEKKNGGA